ncbi:MAG: hypothetical protein HY923_08130 [Elusimicrobia bacterium]|nr:hypothetical protein [Elusimicrobiota bacterium]
MGQLPPEDLNREIERLWTRLGTASTEAVVPWTPPSAGAELAWETVAMLKAQQRRRESAAAEAIEAKEEALKHWRARAEAYQAEADEMRARAEGGQELEFAQLLDAQQRLESAARALASEKARHEEERRALQAALEESRARFAAEAARAREAESRWGKREAQSLVDLKNIQTAAERRQKEAAEADQSVIALKGGLAEAKNALEKTLAELLLERHERTRVEEERARALKKTEEVEAHFNDLQKLWEEERAQWRELWDRERSTWEAQRQELAQWEETLRREREAWHAELQEKEKSHLSFTESLSGKIRETSDVADKVAERMKTLESREARAGVEAGHALSSRARRTRAAVLVLAAAGLFAAAYPAWHWAREWRYEPESVAPVSSPNPAALAFDGTLLWVADWSGRLVALDPADPRRSVREVAAPAGGPLRPTALAFGDGRMWLLDAARARLLRLSPQSPETPLLSLPSPGPAPTALAYDGATLWSYDAVNRALYRHGADEATHKSYPIEEDVVPNALAWLNGRLWLHDTKSRRLMIYALENDRFTLKENHAAPDEAMAGFAVLQGENGLRLYVLAGPTAERSAPALLRLRLRRRIPFAIF